MKKLFAALTAGFLALTLASCGETAGTGGYTQISAEEAKALMDSEKDAVIVDARTEEEYAGGHIPGAVLLPHDRVAEQAEGLLPDKDRLILVNCRSGRRSNIAAQALADLGYTQVKEFGGIIDWPYETVTQ